MSEIRTSLALLAFVGSLVGGSSGAVLVSVLFPQSLGLNAAGYTKCYTVDKQYRLIAQGPGEFSIFVEGPYEGEGGKVSVGNPTGIDEIRIASVYSKSAVPNKNGTCAATHVVMTRGTEVTVKLTRPVALRAATEVGEKHNVWVTKRGWLHDAPAFLGSCFQKA